MTPGTAVQGDNTTAGNQTENPGGAGGNGGYAAGTRPIIEPIVFAIGQPPLSVEEKQARGNAAGVDVIPPKADTYESNPKHALGQQGNRSNASIEPPNAKDIYENSVQDPQGKGRFGIESDGSVHRFFPDNNGKYHWTGSTNDSLNPLTSQQFSNPIKRFFQLPGKGW